MLQLSSIAPATMRKVLQLLSKSHLKKMAVRLLLKKLICAKDTDFNAILTNIKAANPEFVFLPGYYEEVGLIIKQARALGIEAPFMGGDGWDSPKLLKSQVRIH